VLDGLSPVLAKPADSSPTAPSDTARCIVHVCSSAIVHDDHTIEHNYLDHGYIIMIGYLAINGYVYSNSSATNSSQQRLPRHLRPRHSRCDCGRE